MMRTHTRQPVSQDSPLLLAERIAILLRRGSAPRNRAERRAEREIAYGDHLEALLADIRDAMASPRAPAA